LLDVTLFKFLKPLADRKSLCVLQNSLMLSWRGVFLTKGKLTATLILTGIYK